MNIKELIQNIVSRPSGIQAAFYLEKIKSILSWQIHDKNLKRLKVKDHDVILTIKSHISEAIIIDFNYCSFLIKLKNADFIINKSGRRNIKTKSQIEYYIDNIPNLVEYMKEIDHQMPEWEKEFASLMVLHENDIRNAQRDSFLNGVCCYLDRILKHRIDFSLQECRENTETGSILNKTLKKSSISFKNFTVNANGNYVSILLPNFCWKYCIYSGKDLQIRYTYGYKEIKIEHLEQIDRMLPIWVEELSQWDHEYEKQSKVTNLITSSATALIKQKMKSLGCEYFIMRNDKSYLLYMKLKKARMLKLSLPYKSIGAIMKRLEMIEETIKAVNNIHNSFRITNETKDIKWEKVIQL